MENRKKLMWTWRDTVRLVIGVICLSLVIVQLQSAAEMIAEEHIEIPMIGADDYENLHFGQEVKAVIEKGDIIKDFEGGNGDLAYYLVKVNDKHAVLMKTIRNSPCANNMSALYAGYEDKMVYIGRVNNIVEKDEAIINLLSLTEDLFYEHGLNRNKDETLLKWCIDIALEEDTNNSKYVIATVAGALVMLGAAAWAFWKPFRKIWLSYAARLGKYDLGLTTAEDLPVEQGWFTEEDTSSSDDTDTPQTMTRLDTNPTPVEFYESGINEEGNFYVQQSNNTEPVPDENGITHTHKHY